MNPSRPSQITQQQYDALTSHTHQLEQRLSYLQVQAEQAASLEYACSQLQLRAQEAEEHALALQGDNQQLREQLQAEADRRQQAELSAATSQEEAARLQRARDELAGRLLTAATQEAERRAAEAEEEQGRAEEESHAARTELHSLLQSHAPPEVAPPPPAQAAGEARGDLERQLQQEREHSHALALALGAERGARPLALAPHPPPGSQGPRSVVSVDESLASNLDDLPPSPHASPQQDSQNPPGTPHTQQAVQRLTHRVARLKASRDKLLSEVDGQSAELDRMHTHNSVLERGLEEARGVAQAWERQVQEGLATIETLKGLLAEGVAWEAAKQQSTEHGVAQERSKALEVQLLEQKAREASLQLQVAALCAELTRAADVTGDLGRSVLPALTGIEGRLAEITRLSAAA